MMFVLAITQMFVYSASGITSYRFSQWKDSTRCSTHPYQTTYCTTASPCCRTPYGQSMRISGTCSKLKSTIFLKSNDCTGPYTISVGKVATTRCKNDALFHSIKTTCVDNIPDTVVAHGRNLRGTNWYGNEDVTINTISITTFYCGLFWGPHFCFIFWHSIHYSPYACVFFSPGLLWNQYTIIEYPLKCEVCILMYDKYPSKNVPVPCR